MHNNIFVTRNGRFEDVILYLHSKSTTFRLKLSIHFKPIYRMKMLKKSVRPNRVYENSEGLLVVFS